MILKNKKVLITGGTGTLGKALTYRLALMKGCSPREIVIFSRDEAKQLEFFNELKKTEKLYSKITFRIGDIRETCAIENAVRDVDIVFHLAALKQIPSCEYFPAEAISTNVNGAINVIKAVQSGNSKAKKVIAVSTDKACLPVSVMGMSKALQEKLFCAANMENLPTDFISVRYGNVLSSRGSAIPLFKSQISHGEVVTLTDPEMTRFFISIDEAIDAILYATKYGARGEIVVPNLPSIKMGHLVKALIANEPIKIKTIKSRPGEKVHETLISLEEGSRTVLKGGRYFHIKPGLPEITALTKEKTLNKPVRSDEVVLSYKDTVGFLGRHGVI